MPTFAYVGPNWFASVMGTGIIAVALPGLPFPVPYGAAVAAAFWVLAVMLLVAVTAASVVHWRQHPQVARGHLDDPVMAHFYGAPAMALMTVGAGAMVAGDHLVGAGPALALHATLWSAGTTLGLATTVLVPYRALTRHEVRADSAFGGWLMPVVPPMVSAATGALLVPHLPEGRAQQALLLVCYGCFGITLVAGTVMIVLIGSKLRRHGVGAAATVPTLWIVLGPLGQSITAAHHLGRLPLWYGVPVWCAAMSWLLVVAVVTLRTARDPRTGLPFTLAWWSFTFPVGTLVTGTSGLAATTGLVAFQVVAGALFVLLVVAWATVFSRTAHGVCRGPLLHRPQASLAGLPGTVRA